MHKPSWLSKDLIGMSLTSFFNDFCHEMTTALIPTMVHQLIGAQKAPLALGAIMGFADVCATIMKLISGWLADHVRFFKPFVAAGYCITVLFVTLIGTATQIMHVFIYQTIAWLGRGLREPLRDVWLTNITPPQQYGKAFGLERACDTLGAICGPLLAFFTMQLFAIRYNFFIAGIPGILSVLTIIFLTSNYTAANTRPKQESLWAHAAQLPSTFNYFVLSMFVFGIANFNKTLIIYRAQEMFGLEQSALIASSMAIALYVLFNSVRAVGEFTIGYLSDYVNRKFLMAIGFGLFALVALSMVIAKAHISLWIFIFIMAGLSAGIITTIEKSYAAQLLPAPVRGIGFGFLQSIDGVGDLLSSILCGSLWTFFSAETAFLFSAIVSILAIILLLKLKD